MTRVGGPTVLSCLGMIVYMTDSPIITNTVIGQTDNIGTITATEEIGDGANIIVIVGGISVTTETTGTRGRTETLGIDGDGIVKNYEGSLRLCQGDRYESLMEKSVASNTAGGWTLFDCAQSRST